jgi:hypothetical protein
VNKSRAQWRAVVSKIPLIVDDVEKIPQISNDIKSMLNSNPNVFLGKEAPYCYLSRIESSIAELTLGCNLKQMVRSNLPPSIFTFDAGQKINHFVCRLAVFPLNDFHLYQAFIL